MTGQPYTSVWANLRDVTFTQGWLDADGIHTCSTSSGDPSKPLLLLHGADGHAEAYARNFGTHGEHFSTKSTSIFRAATFPASPACAPEP